MHGNAPPDPDGDDDEYDNEEDEEYDDEDEGDVTTTFDKVARCSRGDSYSAERAGTAVASIRDDSPDQQNVLAVATRAIDDTVNDAIDETTTSTSGDESIVATIAPFDEGPESDQGGGTMSEVAIPEGREDAIPRGGTDDDDVIDASDDLKCK